MPAWSLLLRVLLCVAIVFNGVMPAMAAPSTMHSSTAAQSAISMPPCHAHGSDDARLQSPHLALSGHGHGQPDHPGCCKDGHCDCACLGALHLPGAMRLASVVRAGRAPPMQAGVGLAETPATLPIRPPIA